MSLAVLLINKFSALHEMQIYRQNMVIIREPYLMGCIIDVNVHFHTFLFRHMRMKQLHEHRRKGRIILKTFERIPFI